MSSARSLFWMVFALLVLLFSTPGVSTNCFAAEKDEPIGPTILSGFDSPEGVARDPATGDLFVSNMVVDYSKESAAEKYWGDDKDGYISRLDKTGKVKAKKWATQIGKVPLSSPKGMAVVGDLLYVCDNSRMAIFSLAKPSEAFVLQFPETVTLNDVVSDGKKIYTTDTTNEKIYCLDVPKYSKERKGKIEDAKFTTLLGPPVVNGITLHKNKIYAVSFETGDIYRIDKQGKRAARPLGFAKQFQALDGIAFSKDGSKIYVSDFKAGKLFRIDLPQRRLVARNAKPKVSVVLDTGEQTAEFSYSEEKGKTTIVCPSIQPGKIFILEE